VHISGQVIWGPFPYRSNGESRARLQSHAMNTSDPSLQHPCLEATFQKAAARTARTKITDLEFLRLCIVTLGMFVRRSVCRGRSIDQTSKRNVARHLHCAAPPILQRLEFAPYSDFWTRRTASPVISCFLTNCWGQKHDFFTMPLFDGSTHQVNITRSFRVV
jgi:hypothetical protein